MKRICLVVLFLGVTMNILAQEKVLSEAEFNAVWKKGCEKTKNLAQVETQTDEQYYDDVKPPYNVYISVTRYIPLDRVWVIASRKDGSPAGKYEEIRIGRKSYSRDGNGPWKFQELGFSGLYDCAPEPSFIKGKGEGSGTASDGNSNLMRFEYEYRYMGRKDSTDVYVRIKRMIITTDGRESRTTFKYSFWLNGDGQYLKTESETRSEGTERWSRSLSQYDYTAKDLKIEAPIK